KSCHMSTHLTISIRSSWHYRKVVYFLLPIRPPYSTLLFPYTTLFRSIHPTGEKQQAQRRFNMQRIFSLLVAGLLVAGSTLAAETDRKSTRLNSSHVKSSYAVFCLKKKNTRNKRNGVNLS